MGALAERNDATQHGQNGTADMYMETEWRENNISMQQDSSEQIKKSALQTESMSNEYTSKKETRNGIWWQMMSMFEFDSSMQTTMKFPLHLGRKTVVVRVGRLHCGRIMAVWNSCRHPCKMPHWQVDQETFKVTKHRRHTVHLRYPSHPLSFFS